MNNLIKSLALIASFGLYGCVEQTGDTGSYIPASGATGVNALISTSTLVSGQAIAGAVTGSLVVRDSYSGLVIGTAPITSGQFMIDIGNSDLGKELDFEVTGVYTDEVTQLPVTIDPLYPMGLIASPNTFGSGKLNNAAITPDVSIIREMVKSGIPLAASNAHYLREFGYIPDSSSETFDPYSGMLNATPTVQGQNSAFRAGMFSQAGADLGLVGIDLSAMPSLIARDMTDGTMDGREEGVPIISPLGIDLSLVHDQLALKTRFQNAATGFIASPANQSGITITPPVVPNPIIAPVVNGASFNSINGATVSLVDGVPATSITIIDGMPYPTGSNTPATTINGQPVQASGFIDGTLVFSLNNVEITLVNGNISASLANPIISIIGGRPVLAADGTDVVSINGSLIDVVPGMFTMGGSPITSINNIPYVASAPQGFKLNGKTILSMGGLPVSFSGNASIPRLPKTIHVQNITLDNGDVIAIGLRTLYGALDNKVYKDGRRTHLITIKDAVTGSPISFSDPYSRVTGASVTSLMNKNDGTSFSGATSGLTYVSPGVYSFDSYYSYSSVTGSWRMKVNLTDNSLDYQAYQDWLLVYNPNALIPLPLTLTGVTTTKTHVFYHQISARAPTGDKLMIEVSSPNDKWTVNGVFVERKYRVWLNSIVQNGNAGYNVSVTITREDLVNGVVSDVLYAGASVYSSVDNNIAAFMPYVGSGKYSVNDIYSIMSSLYIIVVVNGNPMLASTGTNAMLFMSDTLLTVNTRNLTGNGNTGNFILP